jgi:flagellar basal body rod protein FlgF
MIGALQAGWEYVEGVELTEEYIPIAEARIKYWTNNIKVNKDGTISPIDVTKPSNLQTKVEQISLI